MGGLTAAGRVTNAGTANPRLDSCVIGNASGTDGPTPQAAQMPAHTHTVTAPQNFDELAGTLGSAVVARISTSRTTSSAGGGEAHPNLQPSLVATYVIKI